jgi:Double zinc ribbon
MHTRYCPTCEDEFRPDIQRCSDCGGELVDRYDDEDAPAAAADAEAPLEVTPAPPATPDELRTVFTCLDAPSLKEAADRLHEAGLRFQATGSATGFRLLVRIPEAPAALEALRGLEGLMEAAHDAEPSVSGEGGPCPACSTTVPAEALECPACGLVVGSESAPCRGCGAPIGPEDAHCPACGASAD